MIHGARLLAVAGLTLAVFGLAGVSVLPLGDALMPRALRTWAYAVFALIVALAVMAMHGCGCPAPAPAPADAGSMACDRDDAGYRTSACLGVCCPLNCCGPQGCYPACSSHVR